MSTRVPQVQRIERFELESGEVLAGVEQAYFLDGELNAARDNLIVIFHALTGSADAAGDWWKAVIGPGRPLDTERYAVLCTNLLGSCYGTTGPWEEGRQPFPPITPRDQARLVHALVTELGVERVALAVGGSLGGMVALEWAASFPGLTRTTVCLAAPAAHTASGIAWSHIQRRILAMCGDEGLAIARMVAMMTYRTPEEFDLRFGRACGEGGEFEVASYLSHHGRKLTARFDARSYLALLGAMDAHDVARGRGSVTEALGERSRRGRLIGVGIVGDRLYSEHDVRAWVEEAGAEYREITSIHGHDAFLLEADQVAALLSDALAENGIPILVNEGGPK
jgi:homoserine O-acetyltransferase